jgi:hypothetical protein
VTLSTQATMRIPLLLAPCSEAHPSRMAFLSMGTFIEDLRRHMTGPAL